MKKNPAILITSAAALLSAFALLAPHSASGQTTWDGGAGDDLFGSALNWDGDVAPVPGITSDIAFGGLIRLAPVNNYTAFDDFRNVLFNAGAGAYTISGSAIDLFGKIENNSTSTQTVNLSIGTGSVTGGFIEMNPVSGNLNIGGTDVFLGNNQLRVWGDNGNTLTFGASTIISGTGGSFAINQNSNVVFQSAHTYTGGTFVNAGKLSLAAGGSANAGALNLGDTTGTANATVELAALAGGQTVSSAITVRAGSSGAANLNALNTSGTNTISGAITLNKALSISTAAGGNLAITNAVTGAGSLTKTGDGVLTFSTQKTYTGGTIINGGILDLTGGGGTGGTIRGTVTVNLGGTLRLSGNDVTGYQADATALRTINLVGGTMHVATVLGSTGNQTLGSAAINLTGGFITGVAGSNIDFFAGASTLNSLAASTTSIVSGAQLKIRQAGGLTITTAVGTTPGGIDLSISAPIVNDGAFPNVPITKAGNGTLAFTNQKTYTGGTIINGGILDLTGGGGAAGTIRGTVTINTGGMLRLSAGDVTGFGVGADRLSTINISGGTMHVAVQGAGLNQTLGNATVNLTGGSITGVAGSNLDFFQTTSNLNSLASPTTSTISGVQLSIRQAAGLTITTAAGTTPSGIDLSITSNIASNGGFTGAPLIKAGAGSMELSNANTYVSATNINAGTLIASVNNALGTTAAGTTVGATGTLDFRNVNYTSAEALTVNGGKVSTSSGTSTFAGPITLAGNSTFEVSGTQLTLNGAVDGVAFGITKTGGGTLVLGAANSYTGATAINAGTLALSGPATIGGNITVAPGAVFNTSAAAGTFTLANQSLAAGRASSPANDIVGSIGTGAGSTLNILAGAGAVGTLTTSGNLTFGGGTVNFDLSNVVASGNDKIVIGGTLDLSAATTLAFNRINNALINGSYVLVQGTGAATGSIANLSTSGLISGTTRQTFTLSTTSVANALTLDVAGSAANLVWNNAAATGLWSTAPADANWDNASVNDRFYDADFVTFQNISGQTTQTVGVTGTLTPASVTVNNTTGGTAYTLNGAGKITGTTGIVKGGNGVFVLSNTGGNDFTGATVVNAGTLRIGHDAAVSQASTITVNSGATLDVNGLVVVLPSVLGAGAVESASGAGTIISFTASTISAVMQNGAGGLSFVKDGTGTTSLTGANTYTGPTIIAAGTLQIGNGGTTGSLGATSITNDSVLSFNRSDVFSFPLDVSGTGAVTHEGTGTTIITGALTHFSGTTISAGTLQVGNGGANGSIDGDIITNASFVVNRSNAVTLGNLISGTGGFAQSGAGTTTLTNANTYTGVTTINSGTLAIASVANGGTASNIGQGTSGIVLNGGKLQYTGVTAATNRGIVANAVAGNTVEVTDIGAVLTVGQLSGAGGFTKTGDGTLALTATNSDMAGGLTVFAGVLNMTGGNNGFSSVGSGTLTVGSGAIARAFTHNPFGQGTGTHLSPLVINGGTFESDQYNHINSIAMTGGLIGIRSGVTQVDGLDMKTRNAVNPSVTTNSAATTATISSKMTLGVPTTFNVADGTAVTDLEVSGALVGGSGLTKSGNGTMLVTGAGSYTGGTTITAGTLKVGAGGTTGIITGGVTNNGTLVFDRSDAITYASVIGGAGSVRKDGAGTLTITAAQTYTGGTFVDEGILQLNARLATGGAITVNPGAELHVNATNLLFFNEAITINGGALKLIAGAHNHFNGSLTLNGGSLDTTAGSTAYDGIGNYALDVTSVAVGGTAPSSLGANTGIHLNGSPNFIVANATGDGAADLIVTANLRNGEAGARGITKSGAGTMQIAAASTSTYTGATNVNEGTLFVSGSISGSAVTVNGLTSVLGGDGTTGAVTVQNGGTIAPGALVGKLNIGTLTMNAGTSLSVELNATTPVTGYDQLNVVGGVSLGGATLTLGGSYLTAPAITNDLFFILLNDNLDLIPDTFAGLPDGSNFFGPNGQEYVISYFADSGSSAFSGGNDIALMAVPEPGAAVCLLSGLGFLLGVRRRRR